MRKNRMMCSAFGAGLIMTFGITMTAFAATGWQKEGDEWRYYETDQTPATNVWKKSGDHWFYLGDDGFMVRSQLIEHGDNYYYVNSDGAQVTNQWRKLPNEEPDHEDDPDEVWYYFQPNGKAYTAPQSGRTSFKSITSGNGKTSKYAFDEKGHLLFGWVGEESQRLTGEDAWKEGIYYCGSADDGAMAQNEWRKLEVEDPDSDDEFFEGEYWFYFQSNGKKTVNTKKNINGEKYLFLENGNAKYQWHYATDSNASTATPQNSYYKDPSQCWLAVGWFKTVPSEDIDPQAYYDDEPYWFYGLKNGGVVTNQIKTIDKRPYGFGNGGIMLHGLYKMEVQNKKIISYEKIESEADLPSADDTCSVYYFGDSPKEGVMQTGKTTVTLDGEKYTYHFKTSGSGTEGIYDGAIYEKGRLLTIDEGMRYGIIQFEGKEYLVNQSGKIQKNKKNVKDADNTYYSSDKNGIVTHQGDKE